MTDCAPRGVNLKAIKLGPSVTVRGGVSLTLHCSCALSSARDLEAQVLAHGSGSGRVDGYVQVQHWLDMDSMMEGGVRGREGGRSHCS